MRKSIFIISGVILMLLSNCNAQNKDNNNGNKTDAKVESNTGAGGAIHINTAFFKEKVFNYEANKEWKFEGDKPCIVDFYADWCPPCRRLSPVMEEIAKEYAGKINVYKVNADEEKQLVATLGINSLPTLLFCPTKGQPQAAMGALPKEELKKAIDEVLMK